MTLVLLAALVAIDPRAAFAAEARYVATLRADQLVGQMDHPRYARREAADRELRTRGRECVRMARIGASSSNPEVSGRCKVILQDPTPCEHCRSSGVCLRWQDPQRCRVCVAVKPDRFNGRYPWRCLYCQATGDGRMNP